MVQEQIKGQRSLVIAVGPASHDRETVKSFALARAADPDGIRTIEVITKCDVTDGDQSDKDLLKRMVEADKKLRGGGPTA